MVNQYLDAYEKKGLIKRKYFSTKNVEYFVSKKGSERRKVLNISYLKNSLSVYKSAKENIVIFLKQIHTKGFKDILLYGAGEVAEILLQSILIDIEIPINVSAVIDDDILKQNNYLLTTNIISLDDVKKYKHDGILISSYTNQLAILDKLDSANYPKEKILHFFD
jgi:hypothetical protein